MRVEDLQRLTIPLEEQMHAAASDKATYDSCSLMLTRCSLSAARFQRQD